jgi:hypothetical protein
MPKLTLRDLFAVVTIVALGLGWLVDNLQRGAVRRENQVLRLQVELMKKELERGGAVVKLHANGVAIGTADRKVIGGNLGAP